jgi:hypothetical protein
VLHCTITPATVRIFQPPSVIQKHPSQEMIKLFNQKPYQGQNPAMSEIIFLSSDANYSIDISDHHFFNWILDYQEDGVRFWETQDVHHPFLLPDYPFDKRKDGVVFHRNFSKIGFTSAHAENVSFLELLDVPTTGTKSEDRKAFFRLVSKTHAEYIDDLVLSNRKKLIFVPGGVLRDMREIKKRFGVFNWLDDSKSGVRYEKNVGLSEIREIYHFSSTQIHAFLPTIRSDVNRMLCDAGKPSCIGS